jgi:CubicO group peptidase (beta-lactamase class C family)/D-alanyl-D-alanine dipeptidase
MNSKRICLLAVTTAAILQCAHADELQPQTVAQIEQLIEKLVADRGIPGVSVAVATGNQLSYSRGFGLADVENSVPATADTRYRTASIAKSITAVIVLSLAEQGIINLDAEVQQYTPEYPRKRWSVTSRQLLGHLAGVRHYKSGAEALSTRHFSSLNAALQNFRDDPLLHKPGTKFLYTTFGFNLLGNVVEGATDETFVNLLQQHVLQPAEMSQTVVDDQYAIIPLRTRGYIRPTPEQQKALLGDENETPDQLFNAPLHDTSMKIPGGGLLSTASDLVRFAIALNTGRLLKSEMLHQMWTSQDTSDGQKTGYGLGWSVATRNGHKLVSHTGGQSGTSTVLLLIPETGTSVAVMCNLQNVNLSQLARSVADIVSPQPEPVAATEYTAVIDRLQSVIRHEVEQKQLPAFSISLVDHERVVWSDGFGFQDAKQKIPATADTVYRVGSVSKLFTDIAVMQLVESGELNLDTPVQEYVPDFQPQNPFDIPITLRQLMTHRSGLVRESPVGNYFDPTEPTLTATVASLNGTKLVYKPNTRTKYSNAAIAVVGAVLEKQHNASHADRVQQSILDPLGMNSSGFVVTPNVRRKLATGWMRTYDGRRFEAPTFLLGTGPAGNLYSSVTDLSKFLICMFNDGRTSSEKLLQPETYRLMTSPTKDADGRPLGFGLGFHVQDLDGFRKIGHGGAVYGFSTQLEALPARSIGVAAVASLDGSNGVVRRLTDYALRLMLAAQDGKPLPTYRTTSPVPSGRIQELLGTYRESDGTRLTRIGELNGHVTMQRGSFRYDLRVAADDGTLLTDDAAGVHTQVQLQDVGTLRVGEDTFRRISNLPPAEVPERWKGLIGEYGWDHNTLYILEDGGRLYALIEWFYYYPLKEITADTFAFPDYGLYHGEGLKFNRNTDGTAISVVAAEVDFQRREAGTKDGETFRIVPVKPIDDLRAAALAASPPPEPGNYRDPALVELTSLDPTIKLDIRYASTNNFTGAVFYKQPRAFMQRPAAEAVVRAHQRLKAEGLGLLIHDAYRPWHVTRMFWDATPDDLKNFVANPARGSRHNRGCAVDLTLYNLSTGEPIQMVAGYDEFSARSFPLYPGGTSRQRWYRELLRRTMEAEEFSVYEFEWWHFDFKDWKKYRIGNLTFEQIHE